MQWNVLSLSVSQAQCVKCTVKWVETAVFVVVCTVECVECMTKCDGCKLECSECTVKETLGVH